MSASSPVYQRRRQASPDELARIPWLSLLSELERERIEPQLVVGVAMPGDYVCRMGRSVTFWFGVIEGLLKMSTDSASGRTITYTGVPPGGWFGEGTVLKRESYRYNISALRTSVVAGLPVDTFHWLIDHSIGFNRFVMNQLNERLAQFIEAREIDRSTNPDVRVARNLAALFNPVLFPGVGEMLRITQQELAYLVGLSRQRVNVALNTLQDQGAIRIEYGGMRVLNLQALRSSGLNTPPSEPIRLNKRLAEMGLCSRREADVWIENGWVLVNGQPAAMGVKVTSADTVEVDKRAQGHQDTQVTILLHKPMGYVSGQAEDGHEPAITLIHGRSHWREDPSKNRIQPSQLRGLAPAGRLDIDSVGLLVLTQDGRVARQLIGEDSDIEKEYLVRVTYQDQATDVQRIFPEAQLARLRHGLSLDGKALKPARVEWQNPEQLRFVLKEGKKRQIRRMCEFVGLRVVGLKRVRIGRVTLGNLPVGQWRYLSVDEKF